MKQLHFDSDYMEGAHPEIIKKLAKINFDKIVGYGTDEYCKSAARKIREAFECPNAGVHFLVGGTQTNKVVIASFLRPYEAVIAADTGHIATHESGAIENSGHKVITLPNDNAKLKASAVLEYMKDFEEHCNPTHTTIPAMVYISQPTETGTLYSLEELKALRAVCDAYDLKFFVDGARLGYAFAAPTNDIMMKDLAELADVFYIGGTKIGALFGEAVVIKDPEKIRYFRTSIKQNGALLAKGWLLGVQFDVLFTDQLYLNISKNAIDRAMELKQGLLNKGYTFYCESFTNQQFVILPDEKLNDFNQHVTSTFWEKVDDTHTAIRLVTSWATTSDEIEQLLSLL